MLYCGIDEVGLGPLLGPLVAASCTSNMLPQNIARILVDLDFWPKNSREEMLVADSKQIYRGNFARLEQLALSLYFSCKPQQHSLKQGQLPLQNLFSKSIGELDWYRGIWQQPVLLPLVADRQNIWEQGSMLEAIFDQQGAVLQLAGVLFTEHEFNQKIAQRNNKSLVLRELIGTLIQDFARELGPALQAMPHCTVDRLGGLKRYRPWLCDLFEIDTQESMLFPRCPGWAIQTLSESPNSSEYRLYNEGQGLQLGLGFWVKGDQRNILCAIASVWAKYHRELLMWQFNRYWQEKFPGAPTTSGYYRDAMIFLDYLQQKLGSLPLNLRRKR